VKLEQGTGYEFVAQSVPCRCGDRGYESGWQSCSLIGMTGLKYLSLEFDKEDFNQTVGDMIRRDENFQPFLY
jgi:hypothetical protein